MKNLKLTAKFAIVVIPTFAMIFILTLLIGSTAKSTKNSTEEVLYDRLYIASSNLINADRDYYQAYVSTILESFKAGDPAELDADIEENYQQTYDRVTEAINSVKSDEKLYKEYTLDKLLALNGEAAEGSDHSGKNLETLYTEFIQYLEAWNASTSDTEGIENFDQARDRLNVMEDMLDQYATYELTKIDKDLNAKITGIVIVVVIGIIIITLLVGYVLLAIISGINKVNKSLTELANNNLSFEPAVIDGKDELAAMSKGVISVKEALLTAISTVNTAAGNLSDSIVAVSDGNTRSSDGVSIISNAIDEVSQTSQQVATSAITLNEKTLEMSDAIEAITNSITDLQQASSQIDSINSEATQSMTNVMDSSELSVDAVNDITKQINETNEAVSRIVECIQVISDISSQTNLLSLNASIEAARAGESGRGFAVVAQEIRSLADSCATSAEEIRAIVNDVTSISERTVISAKHVSEVIDKQQNDVRFTQNKFAELSDAVNQNMQGINTIQEMAAGLEKIRNELSDSTSTLSAISEELGASAEDVSATCTQVANDCESTRDMSDSMSETKGKLLDAVSVFKL